MPRRGGPVSFVQARGTGAVEHRGRARALGHGHNIDGSTRAYTLTVDKRAKMLHALSMPAIGTTTLSELSAALKKARAKLTPSEVHALYLGAMTSTNPRFGPQHLIEQILGDDDDGAPNDEPPMALIGAILGYWNHLQEEREAGRVRLAAGDLPRSANQDEILAYAERRGTSSTGTSAVSWLAATIPASGAPQSSMLCRGSPRQAPTSAAS